MKNLIVVLGCLLSVSLMAQNEKDEMAIRQIVSDMATAWTNGDGAGFAEHFADNHDFFVWNGLYLSDLSKSDNARNHQQIFDGMYKGTKHYAVVDKIRFATADVAVVLVMSAVVDKGEPAPEHPGVLWSATVLKNGQKWEIVSFHNADIEILSSAESIAKSPVPVEVMYKNWYTAFADK